MNIHEYIVSSIIEWNSECDRLNYQEILSLADTIIASYECYGLHSGLEEATKPSPNEPSKEQLKAEIQALKGQLGDVNKINKSLNDRIENQYQAIISLRKKVEEK
jgi:hypothetical protein